MRKIKRFNYSVVDSIIGLDFEKAKDICYFNGYLLTNNGYLLKNNNNFYHIRYELKNNKIVKCYF